VPDYTAILSEIARALYTIAEGPGHPWLVPVAILASAGVGWCASQRTIRRQERARKEEQAARRRLVLQLLRDEITQRWQKEIAPYLRTLEEKEALDALRGIARMEFCVDDLFCLNLVSKSFPEYHYLDGSRLLEEIIRGHLRVRDLVDYRYAVARLLQEYDEAHDRMQRALPNEEATARINSEFKDRLDLRFRQLPGKLNALDEQLTSILSRLPD